LGTVDFLTSPFTAPTGEVLEGLVAAVGLEPTTYGL
jgi:hypothetical protein